MNQLTSRVAMQSETHRDTVIISLKKTVQRVNGSSFILKGILKQHCGIPLTKSLSAQQITGNFG